MSWLDDTENHRKRQIEQMAKAFGGDNTYFQKAKDGDTAGKSKKKDKTLADKSDMYKMRMLKLRKFNEQDQKEYVGVEDVANSYITNQENGNIVISKTEDGYLVSKFPIDAEHEEGGETETTTLSEAIDMALVYKEDLENAKSPEEIMYKEDTEKASTDNEEEEAEEPEEEEANPFEVEAWEAEHNDVAKAYAMLGLDYDIEKAKHQDGDMHPNGKWVWRQSANGGKGDWRVAKTGGSKATTGGGAANADTTSKPKGNAESTSDFDSLSSAKTQLEVNKFWENVLTSNSGKGKNLAGKLLDSMKEYGYNNVSGAMTTRGVNTFKFANKDADENITMVPYQDGLVIKTNDKKEILKVSDFKTISDFKKKFDETILNMAGKDNSKKTPQNPYINTNFNHSDIEAYIIYNDNKNWVRNSDGTYSHASGRGIKKKYDKKYVIEDMIADGWRKTLDGDLIIVATNRDKVKTNIPKDINKNRINNATKNVHEKEQSVKKYISENKSDVINGLNKYFGDINSVEFVNLFTGKDKNGKSISGVHFRYSTKKGKFNQDAWITNDGYVADRSVKPNNESVFVKNTYYKVLPDLKKYV